MTREEFNKLIDLYLSGRASAAEEKLIDDFFDAQEKKQTLPHYKLSEDMWTSIEQRIQSAKSLRTGNRERSAPGVRGFSMRNILIPLFLVVALGVGFYFQSPTSLDSSRSWIISESPKGQKSLITLADGSRIFLNSASAISYPETFDSDRREITLTGEAFFEIARDETRPFIVRSDNVVTKVLGTSFNIKAFKGEPTTVTVATGQVQVEINADSDGTPAEKVLLIPNQQVVYSPSEGLITRDVDADRFSAWRNQTLFFDNHTLEEVVDQLERWYNASIEFENERIKNCRINGQYKRMDLRSVLESIHYMYPIKYKFSDQNHIILYGEGCDQ